MRQKIIGIIPARYGSNRMPKKPLADVAGIPLVIRVWQNTLKSQIINRVVIATDNEQILNVCKQYGAEVVMTSTDINSGTDRVFEAYKKKTKMKK